MNRIWWAVDEAGTQQAFGAPPTSSRPLAQAGDVLLPPLVTALHRSFRAWHTAGLSPGPVIPDRLRMDPEGRLFVAFADGKLPRPVSVVGEHAGLAAWLVLLDKWVETFVVVARARAIWSVGELAGALSFTTPSLLPPALLRQPPDNWERVAVALARAVADGPLPNGHTDRHWKK